MPSLFPLPPSEEHNLYIQDSKDFKDLLEISALESAKMVIAFSVCHDFSLTAVASRKLVCRICLRVEIRKKTDLQVNITMKSIFSLQINRFPERKLFSYPTENKRRNTRTIALNAVLGQRNGHEQNKKKTGSS